MGNIIQQFIDTSNNIVEYYNNSKVFKHFKDQKLNSRRHALMEDVNKLLNYQESIPVKIITDYALVLIENYKPFGNHLNCRRCIKVPTSSAVCIFEFILDDGRNLVVSFDPANEDGSVCNINYSYIINGKPSLSFTDANISMIHNYENVSDDNHIADYLRNSTTKCIVKDINEYLRSVIYKEVEDE